MRQHADDRAKLGTLGPGGVPAAVDALWQFTELVVVAGPRELTLRRSRHSGWEVDGVALPDLDEALEVDLSVSPLSNTLPVRRLGLAVGESADITTAYVRVPARATPTSAETTSASTMERWCMVLSPRRQEEEETT